MEKNSKVEIIIPAPSTPVIYSGFKDSSQMTPSNLILSEHRTRKVTLKITASL